MATRSPGTPLVALALGLSALTCGGRDEVASVEAGAADTASGSGTAGADATTATDGSLPDALMPDTQPADTGSLDTAPVDTEAADTAPADTWSEETQAADVQSGDTLPADTQPAEPADTAPADTDPADTDPADTEPADTEPGDIPLSDTGIPPDVSDWKIGVLVVRNTDVGPFRATMSIDEEDAVVAAASTIDDLIREWSGGAGDATVTLRFVDDPPITSLTEGWLWPEDVASILATYAPQGTFDSILVLYDVDNEAGEELAVGCAFCGIAGWPVPQAQGATYAAMIVGDPWWWSTDTLVYTAEGMVHEWLHGSAAYYREGRGLPVPDPHLNGDYGYPTADDHGSWSDWYTALLSGNLTDPERGTPAGFLPCVWASGTPTRPGPIDCDGVVVCGDGRCEEGESCFDCIADCPAPAECEYACADFGLTPSVCDGGCNYLCQASCCLVYDPAACLAAGCR